MEACFTLACSKVKAEKPEAALANIQKQLNKTGGTDFICSDVTVDFKEAYFLPISTVNELRRGVLSELAAARADKRPATRNSVLQNDVLYPMKKLTYMGNVLNSRAEAFYRRHGVEEIEPAAESRLDLRGRKVMRTRYCIKHQLGMCHKMEVYIERTK